MKPVLKEVTKEEPEVTFFLAEEEGSVYLKANGVGDIDEEAWYVAELTPNGLSLCDSIEKGSGIPIDDKGRIKIVEE